MNFIYVIRGSTGTYSDYTQWDAKAYHTEKKAICICDGLNETLKALKLHSSLDYHEIGYFGHKKEDNDRFDKNREEMTKLDKNFVCDYNGADYRVIEIEQGD